MVSQTTPEPRQTESGVPAHLAIVMDGNGRWAQRRHLPRVAGHKQGAKALRKVVSACIARGVKVLTVFAFSTENWRRPQEEVSGLMELLAMALSREVAGLNKEGVQLRFPGDLAALSSRVQQGLCDAEHLTAGNQRLLFNVCINYGGRWDVVQAARALVKRGETISEEALSQALALSHCSDPDLLIRTGGEMRLSNFLLWQCAYAELHFTPTLWPDFGESDLDMAFAEYAVRERRFGLTSSQLKGEAAHLPNA